MNHPFVYSASFFRSGKVENGVSPHWIKKNYKKTFGVIDGKRCKKTEKEDQQT